MQIEEIAHIMDGLAHPTRIKIFHALTIAGQEGLTVGQLGFVVDCPPSTLAHHLSIMRKAQIIAYSRKGRQKIVKRSSDVVETAFDRVLNA